MARHRRVEALREENERLRGLLREALASRIPADSDLAERIVAALAKAPTPHDCTCPDASHFPGTCP